MSEQTMTRAMRPRRSALVAYTAVLLLTWGPAYADEDPCLVSPACWEHYERARQHSGEGRLQEALAEYQAAYRAASSPSLLFNIGRLHHRLGHLQEAAAYYERFLRSPGIDEEGRRRAQTFLGALAAPAEKNPETTGPTAERKTRSRRTGPIVGGVLGGLAATGAVVIGAVLGTRTQSPSAPDGVLIYRW